MLLLDEPLGALDRRLRQEMQVELKQIQRDGGITTIFVTHDQEEALTLSDRIAIINKGRIVQVGPPRAVYERPVSVFTAEFLGDANVFRGTASGDRLTLADGTVIRTDGPSQGIAIVRPEKLTIMAAGAIAGTEAAATNQLTGTVIQAIYSGASVTYRVAVPVLGEKPLLAFAQNRAGEVIADGGAVTISWSPAATIPVAP